MNRATVKRIHEFTLAPGSPNRGLLHRLMLIKVALTGTCLGWDAQGKSCVSDQHAHQMLY